jgi:hypothetical protein
MHPNPGGGESAPPRRRGLARLPPVGRAPIAARAASSPSSAPFPSEEQKQDDGLDVHLLLAVARMRATEAFRKEVRLLYEPPAWGGDNEDDNDDAANNGADDPTRPEKRARRTHPAAFSLLRAAALMTAALDEPQLDYENDVLPAVGAAARAAQRRLLRPSSFASSDALSMLRRAPRPDTERLERVAAAVGAALRLDCQLRGNEADPYDPRNSLLDRSVLRSMAKGAPHPSPDQAFTGPTIAAVLFAELARALGAGVALAGPHDRPLLRLFDREAAERAPTSADVAAGEGHASAWAETPAAAAATAAAAAPTPVMPPPSVIVDPFAALSPQEGDGDGYDDHDTDHAKHAFVYAWLPEAGAWVPTAALDRPITHPTEPPRAWTTLDPSEAPPLATRSALHAALSAAKRSHAASGRFEDALAACKLARAVDPLDADELRDEGALLVGVGRCGEGAARLREYLAVAPHPCTDRGWVEDEVARAEALVALDEMRAARAREAAKAGEGEEAGGGAV